MDRGGIDVDVQRPPVRIREEVARDREDQGTRDVVPRQGTRDDCPSQDEQGEGQSRRLGHRDVRDGVDLALALKGLRTDRRYEHAGGMDTPQIR
jgi:hypothetical protein